MPIPTVPVLFIKPKWAVSGPHPAKIVVPKFVQDNTSDYEAELTIIISKTGKDIAEKDAMDYVLGYTCGNDVSARKQQFANSQWCFSKGKGGQFVTAAKSNIQKVWMDQHRLVQSSYPSPPSRTLTI